MQCPSSQWTIVISVRLSIDFYQRGASVNPLLPCSVHLSITTIQCTSVKALWLAMSICQGNIISNVHLSMHCYQQCVSINALLPMCASVTGLISVWISIHALLTSSVDLSIKYQAVCICQCTITRSVHLSMHVCSWCASANALFPANTCEIFNMRFFQFRWCHFCRLSSQVCIKMGGGGRGGSGGVKDQIFLGCHFSKASYLSVLSHIL